MQQIMWNVIVMMNVDGIGFTHIIVMVVMISMLGKEPWQNTE